MEQVIGKLYNLYGEVIARMERVRVKASTSASVYRYFIVYENKGRKVYTGVVCNTHEEAEVKLERACRKLHMPEYANMRRSCFSIEKYKVGKICYE